MFNPDLHTTLVVTNANLATLDPTIDGEYGALHQHALVVAGDRIQWLGSMAELDLSHYSGQRIDAQQQWLTPGLIDPHTHLIYGGQRATEFEQRLHGASYAEIAAAGGGIQSTVRATRALSQQQLVDSARQRLQALCREGVTTVEIKSGYGLTLDDELKLLRAARQLERELPVRVSTTLLAAHTIPSEYRQQPDAYVDLVCQQIIPAAATDGLADAVDLFCEGIGFNLSQSERVLRAAVDAGLAVKIHAEQLSLLGGAALAARYGALSADHLEYLDDAGVNALAAAGSVATLLPGAYYFLRETQLPPVAALRTAGVPMALASDLNPGTSPFASLRLMMNMGAVLFSLTPAECLAGVTRHAAQALGVGNERGMLRVGQQADLLLWQMEHPAELSYAVGALQPQQRILAGELQHV